MQVWKKRLRGERPRSECTQKMIPTLNRWTQTFRSWTLLRYSRSNSVHQPSTLSSTLKAENIINRLEKLKQSQREMEGIFGIVSLTGQPRWVSIRLSTTKSHKSRKRCLTRGRESRSIYRKRQTHHLPHSKAMNIVAAQNNLRNDRKSISSQRTKSDPRESCRKRWKRPKKYSK